MVPGKPDAICRRMKLGFASYHLKNQLKMDQGPGNCNQETETLGEGTGETLHDINRGDEFGDKIPKAQATKMNKHSYNKLEALNHKENNQWNQETNHQWEKMFANYPPVLRN
jgi:bisphosphoglycerate-dependent phosphoglycerate mutase